MKTIFKNALLLLFTLNSAISQNVIAFWPFDEPENIYPSAVLNDHSDNDFPLILGLGATIVKGKFGNALDPSNPKEINFNRIAAINQKLYEKTNPLELIKFGLTKLDDESISWYNAYFSALMTTGEKHLRKKVNFKNPTKTDLNLGDFDWTIEFWLKPTKNINDYKTVFEIGAGKRTKTKNITALKLSKDNKNFIFYNSENKIQIKTSLTFDQWQHLTFTYDSKNKTLTHYINGKLISKINHVTIKPLPQAEESYMVIGRNGAWKEPLPGPIDELRISKGVIYTHDFDPPGSFSYIFKLPDTPQLKKGPKPLFAGDSTEIPIPIQNRKYLFIDDAILEKYENCQFVPNPPVKAEIVMTSIKGPFRKHLSVLEDDSNYIRLYTTVDDDRLAVWISKDGIHFEAPILPNGKYKNYTNIVLNENVGTGIVFIDPNAPPEEKWKYVSDYDGRGVYLYYSKDGLKFERYKEPIIPLPTGSQVNLFYDEQKGVYSAYLRTGYFRTETGSTERAYLYAESKNLIKPWDFKPLSESEFELMNSKLKSPALTPWYLDNGPLSPPGLSCEYPVVFSNIKNFDPDNTDIYIAKALKYPWAEDVYLAFPVVYFHYEKAQPLTRSILSSPQRKLGSGPLETQIAVSRDGIHWKRYPRPAYVGIGEHQGIDFKTAYIAYGMIKRGNEIWQYCFCEPHYHSPWVKYDDKRAVIRLIHKIDRFVSLDSPYDKIATAITKPLIFKGKKLTLNIDTDATGYAQVGFLDINGNPIPGFSIDECIYINGDFFCKEVEWLNKGTDISELEGKPVKIIFKMRGAKLFSFQFKEN